MKRAKREIAEIVPAFYRAPGRILEELGIEEPEEIIVEAIAQYCGATVLYEPLKGTEARIIGYRDRAFITVSESSTPARRRFSVAHELGHWMWDRGKMAFSCGDSLSTGETGIDNAERRANRYAVELLMPEPLFVRERGDRPLTFETVQYLAETFDTSLTATAIRFVELAPLPMLLVCSDPYRRRWYVRGPGVSRQLKLREATDPRVPAYFLAQGEIEALGPTEVTAARWFENEVAADHHIKEDSVRHGPGLALSLLSLGDG